MSKEFSSKLNARFWYFIYTILGHISTKKLVELRYKRRFGRKLDWENPQTLNEKILWLKQYTDTTEWTRLADKYKVREYIMEKGLPETLVKLYGRWEKAEDIDWENLPNRFIVKTNNGSGEVIICKDKTTFDSNLATQKLSLLLKRGFGVTTGEPHYQRIKPCIIVEELLDCTKQSIPSSSLIDYKIWCFNGVPDSIWACYNRTKTSVEVGTYDLDWNYHPECASSDGHYVAPKQILPKPKSLSRMLEIAAKLSKGFPVVRVDLYEVDGKPYFGEMTFSSNFGMMEFYTNEYQIDLGQKVIIKHML